MKPRSADYEGWVVVNIDGSILDWSFRYSRTEAIKELTEGTQTWKQWYRQGMRCVRATKTITLSIS
jgi:hypothetical protein